MTSFSYALSSLVVGLAVASVIACGARSTIDDAATGEGGAGAGGTTSTRATSALTGSGSVSAASSGSGGGTCPGFAVQTPLYRIFGGSGVAADPELVADPSGDAFSIAYISQAFDGTLGTAFSYRYDWALVSSTTSLIDDGGIDDIALGPGPNGPVSLTHDLSLETRIRQPGFESPPLFFGTAPHLFAVGAGKRVLFATGGADVVSLASYRPGDVAVVPEAPVVCIRRSIASAVPSGEGFLAVLGRGPSPGDECLMQVPPDPTMLSIVRYDENPKPGANLRTTFGANVITGSPFLHGLLTATSFGAWLVYQADWEVAPITAMRILADGQTDPNNVFAFPLSPDDTPPGPIAVGSMGDVLAVAYLDPPPTGPSTIVVQRVEPDGTVGTSARVLMEDLPVLRAGRLRLLGSPDGRALALAWEGDASGQQAIGLVVLGCADGA